MLCKRNRVRICVVMSPNLKNMVGSSSLTIVEITSWVALIGLLLLCARGIHVVVHCQLFVLLGFSTVDLRVPAFRSKNLYKTVKSSCNSKEK